LQCSTVCTSIAQSFAPPLLKGFEEESVACIAFEMAEFSHSLLVGEFVGRGVCDAETF